VSISIYCYEVDIYCCVVYLLGCSFVSYFNAEYLNNKSCKDTAVCVLVSQQSPHFISLSFHILRPVTPNLSFSDKHLHHCPLCW